MCSVLYIYILYRRYLIFRIPALSEVPYFTSDVFLVWDLVAVWIKSEVSVWFWYSRINLFQHTLQGKRTRHSLDDFSMKILYIIYIYLYISEMYLNVNFCNLFLFLEQEMLLVLYMLLRSYFKYRRTAVSTGNTFEDLKRLRETADNTERYI